MDYKRTFYAGSNIADEVAWTSQNSNEVLPSALKRPNAWGLYDMSGNVREWIDADICVGGSAKSDIRESSVMGISNECSPKRGLKPGVRLVRP